jgi:anti-sigma factor RsiW
MKPCSKNRKLLAWLAIGALDEAEAHRLGAHLEICQGCRSYLREISAVAENIGAATSPSELLATASFHRRFTSALSDGTKPSFRLPIALIRWGLMLPAICAVAAVLVMLLIFKRQPNTPHFAPSNNLAAMALPRTQPRIEPTISQYRMALNQSFEKLDALLAMPARHESLPSYSYRASALAEINSPE